MSIIREFAAFVISPHYFENKEKWSKKTIGSLFKLYLLKFVLTLCVFLFTTVIFTFFFEKSDMPERWSSVADDRTFYRALLIVALHPFFEELLLRSWLRKKWGVVFMPPLVLCFIACALILNVGAFSQKSMFIIGFSAILIFIFMSRIPVSETGLINRLSNRMFPWVFWGSAVVFGLGHLTNFSTLNEVGVFAVFLVLPQVLGGLFYGFICMRFSFSAAVFTHSFWNGVLFLISIWASG